MDFPPSSVGHVQSSFWVAFIPFVIKRKLNCQVPAINILKAKR